MRDVLRQIEERKKSLEAGPLCRWLASEESPEEDRFSFLPSMAFLVLGFKDILSFIRIPTPTSRLESQVNVHVAEDSDHWIWYLADLERLGFTQQSWGPNVTDVFRRVWGDENHNVRWIVYLSIHYVRQAKDPLLSLVLIEILEAVFAAFIKHLSVPIARAGAYVKLEYYGKTHVEKETDHAMGSWTESGGPSIDLIDYTLNDAQRAQANVMIHELFGHFDRLFESWYHNRNGVHRYPRHAVIPELAAPVKETTPSAGSNS